MGGWQTSREQFSMYVTCTARFCSFFGARVLCDTCSVVLFPRHVLDRLPRSITRFQSSSHIFFFLFFNISHVQTHAHAHVYTRPSSSQKEKKKKKKRAVLMHVHRVVCIPEIVLLHRPTQSIFFQFFLSSFEFRPPPPPASPAHAYRLLLVCAPRNNSACTRRPARQHTQSTELTVYLFWNITKSLWQQVRATLDCGSFRAQMQLGGPRSNY